jgi:hypothetical protein
VRRVERHGPEVAGPLPYTVNRQLRAWLDDEREHVAARLELREQAFCTLREAGVDMPFETFRVEPVVVDHRGAAESPVPA